MPKFLASCHYSEEDISRHLEISIGDWPVQMNGNKFATGQILKKPVEVGKGQILAGWAQKSPEPCSKPSIYSEIGISAQILFTILPSESTPTSCEGVWCQRWREPLYFNNLIWLKRSICENRHDCKWNETMLPIHLTQGTSQHKDRNTHKDSLQFSKTSVFFYFISLGHLTLYDTIVQIFERMEVLISK